MARRLTRAGRARRERATAARARSATVAAAKPATAGRIPLARGDRGRAARVGVGSELAERAAWSMLAALAALVGAGVALALAGSVVPALCPRDDGTCTFGWMVVIGMGGYLLALLPASAIGGLGVWFWLAYLAGFAPLMVLASVGDWWWWTSLVLLPPLAAVAGSPFGRLEIPRWQRLALILGAAAGLATVVWWYAFAT